MAGIITFNMPSGPVAVTSSLLASSIKAGQEFFQNNPHLLKLAEPIRDVEEGVSEDVILHRAMMVGYGLGILFEKYIVLEKERNDGGERDS